MRCLVEVLTFGSLAGCYTGSALTPAPVTTTVSTTTTADRADIERRARDMLAGMIAHTVFAPDALIVQRDGGEVATNVESELGALRGAPVVQIVADATPDALWFAADISTPGSTIELTHVSGLATRDAGWKIVAGALSYAAMPSHDDEEHPLAGATPAGEVTGLVVDGIELARRATSRTLVVGPNDERAFGAAALGDWGTYALVPTEQREVHGKTWAYVEIRAEDNERKSMGRYLAVFAVVVRDRAAWAPVLVHRVMY
jgi:hypothetical protein